MRQKEIVVHCIYSEKEIRLSHLPDQLFRSFSTRVLQLDQLVSYQR